MSQPDGEPSGANVVIVEDEREEAVALADGFASAGMVVQGVATTVDEFAALLSRSEVDAASLDWELKRLYQGRALLRALKKRQPAAARVVFSKHWRVERQALQAGADAFVPKPAGGDVQDCVRAMQNGTRLGLARRIAAALADPDGGGSRTIHEAYTLDAQAERDLYDRSRARVLGSLQPQEDFPQLLMPMIRRGWWRVFEPAVYARLQPVVKLRTLVDYAQISTDDLTLILGPDLPSPGTDGALPSVLSRGADGLLSCLAFFLRRSQYQPDLMARFCYGPDPFESCMRPPPWSPGSLVDYLRSRGREGLSESLLWIRSL